MTPSDRAPADGLSVDGIDTSSVDRLADDTDADILVHGSSSNNIDTSSSRSASL
jgi:hypothetical protein